MPLDRRLLPGAARRGAAGGAAAGGAGDRQARGPADRAGTARRSIGRGRCWRTRPAIRCWARWPTPAASFRWPGSSGWSPRARGARCRAWPRQGWSRWATRSSAGGPRRRWRWPSRPPGDWDQALPKRAAVRRVDHGARSSRRAPTGLPLASLTATERTHVRALSMAGLARVEHRPIAAGAPAARRRSRRRPLAERRPDHGGGCASARAGGGFASFLLHGVTGSGKTEVYLRVIAAARAAGRGALVLVPEIALTPQLAARFRGALRRGRGGAAQRAAAARAAGRLAAAARGRGRHRARGALGGVRAGASARRGGRRRGARPVVQAGGGGALPRRAIWRWCARSRPGRWSILGSATPSLESALQRRRAAASRGCRSPSGRRRGRCPRWTIVDLRRHPPGPDGLLSAPLSDALGAALAAGEQSILFLNRRGFSTVMLCRACGQVVRCDELRRLDDLPPRARAPLLPLLRRHHAGAGALPVVQVAALERLGTGTERVEAIVRERFPDARVARLDRDTAGSGARGRSTPSCGGCRRGEIDLLVGTQMVTKGHDFPGVTLVGVLQPDQGMRPARLSRHRADLPAARAGGGAGRPRRSPGAGHHPDLQARARRHHRRRASTTTRGSSATSSTRARMTGYPAVHPHDRAAARRARAGAARPAPTAAAAAAPPRAAGRPRSACAARRRRRSAGCAAGPAGRSGCRRTSAAPLVAAARAAPAPSKTGTDSAPLVDVDPQSVL